jgi:hypothetical protein
MTLAVAFKPRSPIAKHLSSRERRLSLSSDMAGLREYALVIRVTNLPNFPAFRDKPMTINFAGFLE